MRKFKVGDKVKINPKSNWKSQIINTDGGWGTIIAENKTSLPYSVRWKNNYRNSYAEIDLIIKPKPKFKGIRKLII